MDLFKASIAVVSRVTVKGVYRCLFAHTQARAMPGVTALRHRVKVGSREGRGKELVTR